MKMQELTMLLTNIEDSYYDFVSAMLGYAKKKPLREKKLIDFIKDNSSAKSSDVIRFVSCQADFYEDAAYMNFE